MAAYTTNYGLHQWVPEDDFLRTDFNTDFQKIDTVLGQKADASALSEKCSAVTGTYIGDGASDRTISLGFQPKAVFLREELAEAPAFAAPDAPAAEDYNSIVVLEVAAQGFQVHHRTYYIGANKYICRPYTNQEGETYAYLALRQ